MIMERLFVDFKLMRDKKKLAIHYAPRVLKIFYKLKLKKKKIFGQPTFVDP